MMNIKTAITAMALMLMPTVAIAEPSPRDVCPAFSELAGEIMEARQVGVPMTTMMGVAAQRGGTTMGDLEEGMIIDAFSEPRYNTEEFQQKAIGDFADRVYLTCITLAR